MWTIVEGKNSFVSIVSTIPKQLNPENVNLIPAGIVNC